MRSDDPSSSSSRADSFAPTRWTLVYRAKSDSSEARHALAELSEIYYAPVFDFIRRWLHGHGEDKARELTHEFFAALLARDGIGNPEPAKGRFRSFLLGAVKHFLARRHEAAQTQKRGGGVEHVSISTDDSDTESGITVADAEVPMELIFDRAWAFALIGRALKALEQEMSAAGKQRQFTILKPWLDGNATATQAEAALQLQLSENALKVAIHRLRQRFRALIRNEVGATVHDPSELDAELRHLVDIVASAS